MTHGSNFIATVVGVTCVLALCCINAPARAWGDEGHEVIGQIADHYLESAVRAKVNTILAGDLTGLTRSTQIDQEATWADKFRDPDDVSLHPTGQLAFRGSGIGRFGFADRVFCPPCVV